MRVLLAACFAGAFLAVPAQVDPMHFERECSKIVDSACYHDFCGIIDCIRTDCVVFSNVTGDGNSALCYGKARPRQWETS